ncbi:MAG: MIP family channel protein [bacterium]|nr:MIP family channel protein [bacterium]
MSNKHIVSQYLAEFIGTFFLVFFGCGAVIVSEVSNPGVSPFIPIVFGGAVAVMIYAVGHISGAHFNPAVTLAFWLTGRLAFVRVPGYIVAQCLGAIAASAVHAVLWGADHSFGATAFSSGIPAAVIMELILSFALMFVIISVATDARAVGELAGLAIGTTVAICAFTGGPLTGASMNPARSLGPALLAGEMTGLWLYLIVPILGACAGALVYERIRCERDDASGDGGAGCC